MIPVMSIQHALRIDHVHLEYYVAAMCKITRAGKFTSDFGWPCDYGGNRK
jgi:hypothetical protein